MTAATAVKFAVFRDSGKAGVGLTDAAYALEDANRRLAKSLEDRKAIVADQARLRENLRVAAGDRVGEAGAK